MTLIHLIAAFGICFGLQNDKALFLTKYIRKEGNFFDKMFDCSYCTGFHSGWIVWLLSAAGTGFTGLTIYSPIEMVVFAFASAAFCMVTDVVSQYVEVMTAKAAG